jgi:polysaccharide biosynthesis protein PslG
VCAVRPGARSLVAAVCVAVLLCAVPASASAARPPAPAPPVLFGSGGWSWPGDDELQRMSDHGLKVWRVTMSWSSVSPREGVMDFSGYDQFLRRATAHGIEVMATLTGCPAWACPGGGPPAGGAALEGFEAFVAAAVARYGPHGSLWNEGGARIPVRYWQVLNEVNGADQWPSPSPAAYAAVLRRTSATIRGTDPGAKVVLAGLGEKMTIWLRSYLPALYRQPGFRESFDVMAPEGYAIGPRDVPRILGMTRLIMQRYGDAAKPMFVTEMSWPTGGPPFPFTTSEQGQAERMQASWRVLRACRAHWKLRRVYWFSFADHTPPPSGDYWGYHNGLVDASGREKPAYQTFLTFLRPLRSARETGRCPLR